jgi:ribosomal-protein-alanine N-acetyltransferase
MKNKKKPQLQIKGKRVFLRYPSVKDAEEFISLSRSSEKFHRNLVSPARDFEKFRQYIKGSKSVENKLFLICRIPDQKILGVSDLSQIFYGGFKNAYLGYYLFENFIGHGYMTEAIRLTLKIAFQNLKLHRLEANIQPHNFASLNVVKKCGFTKEGISRKYLKIGGKWCDHERWAIIKEDWELIKKENK